MLGLWVLSWLLAACQTADPLAAAVSGQIRPGQSREEVQQRLGAPTSYEQALSGDVVEVFESLRTIFGSYGVREREEALEIRQFSVRYDAAGVVKETYSHRGVLEGFTMLYSRSLGPEITREKLAKVRSGQSTRAEVEALFGPASLGRLNGEGGLRLEWIYEWTESGALAPGRVYRSIEVTLDGPGVVQSVKAVDRVFPDWRRSR